MTDKSEIRMTKAEDLTLRPVQTGEDLTALRAAARSEKHGIHAPTHVIEHAGRAVGYASVAAIPLLTGWVSEDVTQELAETALDLVESEARRHGFRLVCIPATSDCRFKLALRQRGYVEAGHVTFNLKTLD